MRRHSRNDQPTRLEKAGLEVKAQWESERSGFNRFRVRHFIPGRGETKHNQFDSLTTLARILQDEETLAAARKFEGRVATTDAFWRDLCEAAATGPREFQVTPKTTPRQQADILDTVIRDLKQLAETVEYASVPVFPIGDEHHFFQEMEALHPQKDCPSSPDYRNPRAPHLAACSVKVGLPAAPDRTRRSAQLPSPRAVVEISLPSLLPFFGKMIKRLEDERTALRREKATMQLNKGNGPRRFMLDRLDTVFAKHFPREGRRSDVPCNPLIAAIITAACLTQGSGESGETLSQWQIADDRKYLKKVRRKTQE